MSTLARTAAHQAAWKDGDRILTRQTHQDEKAGPQPVLVALLAAEHASRASLDRLAHEYGLRDELDSAWAAKPLELIKDGGCSALVLEDCGGVPLHQLIGERKQGKATEAAAFLRLAIGIATAVGKMHERGLVHRDIKPANILVDEADAQVRLTGFGVASRLSRERQAPEPPEVIAGTLAYMAPEQTGRMNRSVDSRSDLYAIGITFYEMLTGKLPFTASDPMEWVHCHIARRPVPPSERMKKVPRAVSAIIMKLLAKNAEERYQTAGGVERDLRRCLDQWETEGRIGEFPLGEYDTPGRLLIPEKLYGREREIEILLAAFERVVTSGTPELVLVSGYSGIGKSAIVHELHKVLVTPRGLFASGKFDQHKRDIPYATLAQAFRSLIRGLLAKSDADLALWCDALLEALGPNGQLVIDVVPELKLIIGDQPPVADLPPQDAQRRFQLVFRRFIGVFARPEHPLALFLDDLQWLDAATLDLLEDLMTRSDVQPLLLIGAYRDNEVTAAHPLRRKLDAIRAVGCKVAEITLAPLSREHLRQLIADALHSTPARAAPLAQLVHDKTGGNPFFAIQFISSLAEEGMLTFDHDAACWSWDLGRIHAKGYTDNVVDLLVGKLTRLPPETRKALQQFACLGNIADNAMLSLVLETPDEQVHGPLWPAVSHGLLERLAGAYRFVHDRVQEAAYSLIPEERRGELHLRIGRLLAANTAPELIDDHVFDIVSQLNRGAALITSAEERKRLAEFNLLAGKRAKASTAYASALNYFVAGATMLPKDAWQRQHQLAFALELNRAECEFLTGALADAEDRLAQLSNAVAGSDDQAAVACLRVDLYTALGQTSRSVAVGLDYLRQHLDIDWSPHPADEDARREYARIWLQLGSRTIEDLVELPLMSDPASLAALDVLTKLVSAVWHTNANLACMAICGAVNLSLERGNSDGSCYHYVSLGHIAGARFGDYEAGFRFGQLGCQLVEKHDLKRFQARTYKDFGAHVLPWTKHVRTGRDILRRALEIANQSGDLTFAGYSYVSLNSNMLAAGDALVEVQRQAEIGLTFARNVRFQFVIDLASAQLGLVRTLRGLTRKFGSFDDDDGLDELEIERRFSDNPNLILAETGYYVRKLQARFFAGDYEAAVAASLRAQRLPWIFVAPFEETPEHHFYGALARAACCDSALGDQRARHMEALAAHHRQLQVYAENCPQNFENRAALVGAEIARIEGREIDAVRLYEQAIRSARANGFIHQEALAYELAARFYAEQGFEDFTRLYFRNARNCYLRWGADGKVRQLDELSPHLRDDEPAPVATSTIEAPIEHLDLATVIKVSQAVAGEIVLEKLIDTVLRIALEQAGAERGLLILSQGAEPRMIAEATTRGNAIDMDLRDEPVTALTLPESVLHYVVRTNESVILDDAAAHEAFADDPYVIRYHARSIVCMPLLNQSVLTGVLYLENNLAHRVFVPARIAVLKILASQAATALENTRLYRDLEEREARIRRLVEANIIGIFIRDIDGRIVEANEAFLRMVGYSRDELFAGRLLDADLTPPEWRGRDVVAEAELKVNGSVQPFEKEYQRKDGGRVPVMIGEASFEGSADQAVAFVVDLSDRKHAEERLRASESRFRTFVDHATDAFFLHADDLTVIDVNRQACESLGYSREELIGTHPRDFDGGLDHEALATVVDRVDAGQTATFETLHRRKDGTVFPVEVRAGRFQQGDQWFRLSLARDITSRKQAENALQYAQAELAHMSRLTTMGELAASIAHEVRQPLTGLVGSGNACLRYLDADPRDIVSARRAIERMIGDAFRASEVIDRIRAMAKKSPERRDRLNINDIVSETIALVSTDLQRAAVSLNTDLSDSLPAVVGDQVQLQQVVLNLVVNAKDAMTAVPKGSRELTVSTERAADDTVVVAVRDSGPPIDSAKIDEMFEAFYSTKAKGMGLGLTISRTIIEAHHGRLWAVPNEPHGAIFQFTLPVEGEAE